MELKTKSVDCKLRKKHCLLPVNGGLLNYDNTKNCINLNPSSK